MGSENPADIEYIYPLGRKERVGGKGAPNEHELNRNSIWGMFLNTGPSQPYRDPSGEMFSQAWKFVEPFENPGAYIIPGMYPSGDFLSVFTTVASPTLGAISGATDDKHIKEFSERLRGETLAKRFAGLEKPKEEGKESKGSGEGRGNGGSGLSYKDQRDLYGDISINIENKNNYSPKIGDSKKKSTPHKKRSSASYTQKSSEGFYVKAILSNYDGKPRERKTRTSKTQRSSCGGPYSKDVMRDAILSEYQSSQDFFDKIAQTKNNGRLVALDGKALILEGNANYRPAKKK